MGHPKKAKPDKPRADFPLFAHASGSWAKKVSGKLYYFGSWNDPDAALQKWLRERDYLLAGRAVPLPRLDALTIRRLVNEFLTLKHRAMEAGRLSRRMFQDYSRTVDLIVATYGLEAIVEDLTPQDFAKLLAAVTAKSSKPGENRSLAAVANLIRWARCVFKFAHVNGLIDNPVRFGDYFNIPSAASLRGHAASRKSSKKIPVEDLRTIINEAPTSLRAMVLLALNAGFGPTDIATLTFDAVDLDGGWYDHVRHKTASPRMAKLWPETCEALRQVIADRPKPKDVADKDLVFITPQGGRWVFVNPSKKPGAIAKMVNTDKVGIEFRRFLKARELPPYRFYNLRSVFRTVADEVLDKVAADLVMGHSDPSMAGHYRIEIVSPRLERIADHVHDWLFPQKKAAAKRAAKTPAKKRSSGRKAVPE